MTTEPGPTFGVRRIVISKGERKLFLYEGEKLLRTYRAAFGFAAEGNKKLEGDGKTPEGEFYIVVKNPESKFHLSLGISYPGIEAATRGIAENAISQGEYDEIATAIAEKRMPPQKTKLGGEIYIHGGGNSNDWTEGCIALADEDMTELFEAVGNGIRVTILA